MTHEVLASNNESEGMPLAKPTIYYLNFKDDNNKRLIKSYHWIYSSSLVVPEAYSFCLVRWMKVKWS